MPAPKVGEVFDGYAYRGGDPNAKASWEWAGAASPAKKPLAGAETRTRLALGLGPAVEAQRNMLAEERAGNPLNTLRGGVADFIDGDDNNAGALAKWAGGQTYQNYNQAAKTFESAFLPILSGAAVSPSEAQRLIKASLPQRGDSKTTLERKAKNRAMMLNGAAEQAGQPLPFPGGQAMQQQPAKRPPLSAFQK